MEEPFDIREVSVDELSALSSVGSQRAMDARVELGRRRCAAFVRATQNRSSPGFAGSYGTGKPRES